MALNDPRHPYSLERYLIEATSAILTKRREAAQRQQTPSGNNRSALTRLGDIAQEKNPADLVRAAHAKIIQALHAIRTQNDVLAYSATVLSVLLVEFPLRQSHWHRLTINDGPLPTTINTELLHIRRQAEGAYSRYSIVVPIKNFKNSATNGTLVKLARGGESYVEWRLHTDVGPLLDDYLERVRPRLVGVTPDERRLFGPVNERTLFSRLTSWQVRHLTPALGYDASWSFHPYRSLVAVSLMKNTSLANPVALAAMALVDSEPMVRSTYGRFLPQDANQAANAGTRGVGGNT
jgi:hypothetical protein